jgi:hypothetical protein
MYFSCWLMSHGVNIQEHNYEQEECGDAPLGWH